MASRTTAMKATSPNTFETLQDKSYSFSLITHQRRPALIPTDNTLNPEDEQSVRMRTGKVNPLEPADELTFLANGGGKAGAGTMAMSRSSGNEAAHTGMGIGGALGGKRKASALDRDEEKLEEREDVVMREE